MALATDIPIQRAQSALEALISATNHAECSRAWSDFLIQWQRGINKADGLGKWLKGPAWRRLPTEIEADEMLRYLREARNSDEHGLLPIDAPKSASLRLAGDGPIKLTYTTDGSPLPDNPNSIEVPVTPGEQVEIHIRQPGQIPPARASIVAERLPERMMLLPIEGRSQIFPVPTSHWGNPVDPTTPAELGELAMNYLRDVVARATAP